MASAIPARVPAAPSIRRTLWVYLAVLSAAGAILLFFAAREYGRQEGNRSYDHLLVSSALSIMDSIALSDGHWQVDLPYPALALLAMAPEDRVFYRVFDDRGEHITGYADAPSPVRMPTLSESAVFFDAPYSGELVRFVVVHRVMSSASEQRGVYVQVGQTRIAREAISSHIVAMALVGIGVLSLLSFLLVGVGVHRALRPLRRIERDLLRREPSDLSPLGVPAPQEMGQVVMALNWFMKRLSNSNEAQRAFMAEAAHQMRTPLAAIRAQAQLALDDEDDLCQMRRSLKAIERNAARMTRLLNQMLSDASVTHRSHLQSFGMVDMEEVVRQALHETFPRGDAPDVRLVLSGELPPLRGDALLLCEAIKNLLDNARKYGGNGLIEVTIAGDGMACVLTVADRGPGIPDADLDRVFERFSRAGDMVVDGAGLGLAIVRRVVESHRGRIDLRNRLDGGLVVVLTLPGLSA